MPPDERVLLYGDAEAPEAVFRVLVGIWPWGHGQVDLPTDAGMVTVGPRPFLPEGTLREAVAFPDPAGRDGEEALRAALESVGLGQLVQRLDESTDWARVLSRAELQRLSFARLLLLRPDWIVLGDATDVRC